MEAIRDILAEIGLAPSEAALAVALFLIFGYISFLIFMECNERLWPKAPPQGSKVGTGSPAKKPVKSREQLLKPIEKRSGVREMSLEELAGAMEGGGGHLIGCKGRVFDVSSNEMYAPGQSYHLFVGKDASVALSKMKFNKEFLDPSQLHWSRDLDE